MRPLLLDLYCGAGGAAMGYHRAGFDIIGVDIAEQPHYPFDFYKGDALTWIEFGPDGLGEFAAIHASPPCQHHTTLAKGTNNNQADHPELIAPTRELLKQTGLPYIIENVATANLHYPITLCGEMFGLGILRHRGFESNHLLLQPSHAWHRGRVAGWRHGEVFRRPLLRRLRPRRRQRHTRRMADSDGHRLDANQTRTRRGDPARLHRIHRRPTHRRSKGRRMTAGAALIVCTASILGLTLVLLFKAAAHSKTFTRCRVCGHTALICSAAACPQHDER